jgi:hypothetical protein
MIKLIICIMILIVSLWQYPTVKYTCPNWLRWLSISGIIAVSLAIINQILVLIY